MECLGKIADIFQDRINKRWVPEVRYNYREVCTVSSCIQKFKEKQLTYLPLFLALYITLTFPCAFDKVLNHDDIAFNEAAKTFNAQANCLYKKTGKESYRKARIDLMSEYDYTPNSFFVIKTFFLTLALIPALYPYCSGKNVIKFFNKVFDDKWSRQPVKLHWIFPSLCAIGGLYGITLMFGVAENAGTSMWGVSIMAGLYACISSCYNMTLMRFTPTQKIALEDVPQLLHNKNIIIL